MCGEAGGGEGAEALGAGGGGAVAGAGEGGLAGELAGADVLEDGVVVCEEALDVGAGAGGGARSRTRSRRTFGTTSSCR